MTDTDTTQTNRYSPSRRTVLAGLLGSPALFGIAVGSYEATTRSTLADGDAITGTVCELDDGQDELTAEPTALSVDPRILDELGLSVGSQLRVERTPSEFALYTILTARPEAPADLVRMSDAARCRLDLGGRDFPGVGDCPGAPGDCSIADETFEATLTTSVVDTDLSPASARSSGGFVEIATDRGSDTLVVAAHGGAIEPRTDEQAALAGDLAGLTTWRTMGYRPGGGSFARYRVPSRLLDPSSFPELASIADQSYAHAVSFNGLCESGIEVGGDADEALKAAVANSINDALPSCTPVAEPVDAYTHEDFLVNRLADQGLFVSQSWDVRRAYAERIATGVAAAFDDSIVLAQGC